MTDEALKKRREYYKNWNAKNREKIRAYNEKYWEKKAAQQTAEPELAKPPVKPTTINEEEVDKIPEKYKELFCDDEEE